MNKKQYRIDWAYSMQMAVIVDLDILTEEKLYDINNFWCDADDCLDDADDDVLVAVLRRLAKECFILATAEFDSIEYLISKFDYQEPNGGIEGWPKMDGTEGFQLLFFAPLIIDNNEIDVMEVENV